MWLLGIAHIIENRKGFRIQPLLIGYFKYKKWLNESDTLHTKSIDYEETVND